MSRLDDLNSVRKMQNIPALDKLPEGMAEYDSDTVNDNTTPVVKDAVTTDTTTPEDKNIVAEVKPAATAPKKVEEVKKPSLEDLSTEDIIKFLEKKGHKVALDGKGETEEEKKTRRDQQKMAWAFSNNKLTLKDQQSYNADSADEENLVYREYLKEQKKADSSLSDADIWDEFQKKYDLEADPDSRLYKHGQKLIQTMADNILKEKYPSIFKIDPEYSEYEATENSRKEQEEKILKGSPAYISDVEEIFTKDLVKKTVNIGDQSITIDIPQNILDEVKASMATAEKAIEHVTAGTSKDALKTIADMTMLYNHFDAIVEKAAKQYLDNHLKGIRGIPNEVQNLRPKYTEQTPEQIAALQKVFPGYQGAIHN